MPRTFNAALAAIVALTAPTLSAQATPSAPPATPAPAVTSMQAIAQMKSALRNLVTAQQKYWPAHGSYTTDGVALGVYPVTKGQPMVQVIFAGSRGWTGIAHHAALKGSSCVIYIGNTAELAGGVPATEAKKLKAESEGAPMCDEP